MCIRDSLKAVKRKLSDLDKAKIDEQKRAVRSGFDMDILPPDLVTVSYTHLDVYKRQAFGQHLLF